MTSQFKPSGKRGEVLSREEGRKLLAKKRGNKFNAKKVVLDGIEFDSIRESEFYAELKLLEKAGEVCEVELQKPFVFTGPQGEVVTTYKADFAFYDNVRRCYRVIDVKGVETAVFKIKRKMMRAFKGIDVEVVR